MKMTKIFIDYIDGQYCFQEADEFTYNRTDGIEVPASTIEMWRAVFRAEVVIQQQLRELDNEIYERLESSSSKE